MADALKAEAAKTDVGAIPKKTKHRSPNYPAIGLRKAVERLEELYKDYKRHWIPLAATHERWAYKPLSGAGNQVVAAVKAYGLIDVQGDGDQRQIRVSDIGFHIVENHRDRPALLKQAATAPALHAELWKRYGVEGFPPDEIIRHYLKFDRGFNPESVDPFIAQFRDTVAFSNLNSSDKMPENTETDDDEGGDEMRDDNGGVATVDPPKGKGAGGNPKTDQKPEEPWMGPKMTMDLPGGNCIEIRLRAKVTADEFKKIKRVYDLSELSFVKDDDDVSNDT